MFVCGPDAEACGRLLPHLYGRENEFCLFRKRPARPSAVINLMSVITRVEGAGIELLQKELFRRLSHG